MLFNKKSDLKLTVFLVMGLLSLAPMGLLAESVPSEEQQQVEEQWAEQDLNLKQDDDEKPGESSSIENSGAAAEQDNQRSAPTAEPAPDN